MDSSIPFGLSTGVYPYGFPTGDWFARLPERMEEWGFDDVVCYVDRPTWPHPVLDPLVLLSIAAATTRRARLFGMVVSTQWVPLLLAKQIASIDYVAGGRVTLGLALGGDYPMEMRACGVDPAERVGRLEEGLAVMRALWTGDPATLEGRFQTLDRTIQLPRPAQPTIPIWLAHRARSLASMLRTALQADGWLPSWVSPRRLRRARQEIFDLAARHGRKLERFEIGHVIRIYFGPTAEAAADQVARFRVKAWGHPYEPDVVKHLQAVGPPDACRERIAEFVAAGADRIFLQAECPWPEFDEQMRMIRSEILDRRGEIAQRAREIQATTKEESR
jgi:alkanesulfonate monooxygenase SsuD/methylene tetrahydromethanopterin reductase-like flavin-dependent oxidoreductase (luciferase family)